MAMATPAAAIKPSGRNRRALLRGSRASARSVSSGVTTNRAGSTASRSNLARRSASSTPVGSPASARASCSATTASGMKAVLLQPLAQAAPGS